MGFQNVTDAPGWGTGQGNVVFSLANMRAPVTFEYVPEGGGAALGASNAVAFADPNEVLQVGGRRVATCVRPRCSLGSPLHF